MSIYLAIFEDYPDEVKVGRSVSPKKRVQKQVGEHGTLLLYEEFVGEGDKSTELYLTNSLRKYGQRSGIFDIKSGATEFFKISKLSGGLNYFREILQTRGYIKTQACKDDFKIRPINASCGHYISKLKTSVTALSIIDSVILTAILADKPVPDKLSEFNKICQELGEENDWCTVAMLKAAKEMSKDFPDGILNRCRE